MVSFGDKKPFLGYKVDIDRWRHTMKKHSAKIKKTFSKNKKRLQWDSNQVPATLRANGFLHLRLLGTPVDEQWVL